MIFQNAHRGRVTRLAIVKRYVILTTLLVPTVKGHPQVESRGDSPPAWRLQTPALSMQAIDDTRSPGEIRIEDEYFDFSIGAGDPLDGPQTRSTYSSAYVDGDLGDFPPDDRGEIVVGHFSTWISHLSSSHLSIYTTVNLHVDRVVNDKNGELTNGCVVPLIIPGGTVRLGNTQRVISAFVRRRDFPLDPNQSYLLFLSYRPKQLPFYEYVKAWGIEKDALVPIAHFDIDRASQGKQTHSGIPLGTAIQELKGH
jgi:hypothetical protein